MTAALTRTRRCAFTLVELLVVIAILGLLIAMLVPAGASAWSAVQSTRCQNNLHLIWQAENSWRADKDQQAFTRGGSWPDQLFPYIEDHESIYICPASDSYGGGRNYDFLTVDIRGAAIFKFIIYALPNATDGYTPLESYPIEIPLDGSNMFATIVSETDSQVRWHCDDGEHPVVGGGGGDDIQFVINYSNGVPVSLDIEPGSSSSRTEYRYEFWVQDEVLIEDWRHHYNANVKLPALKSAFKCDYGISRGTYEVLGRDVYDTDGSLFLVLDYPTIVADYNNERGDNDPWDKYFIDDSDLETWHARYGSDLPEDVTWGHFQALRHFGRANVLFCDGHIESLGPEDLEETEPRWYFGASGRHRP